MLKTGTHNPTCHQELINQSILQESESQGLTAEELRQESKAPRLQSTAESQPGGWIHTERLHPRCLSNSKALGCGFRIQRRQDRRCLRQCFSVTPLALRSQAMPKNYLFVLSLSLPPFLPPSLSPSLSLSLSLSLFLVGTHVKCV